MIRNRNRFAEWLPAGFDGEFDWDFILPAFTGTKIEPMDFDAVIERNGFKLVIETKQPDKRIPLGQSITLTSAWKKDGYTIFHVTGKTAPAIEGLAIYDGWEGRKAGAVGDRPLKPCNAPDILFAVRRWFCKADGVAGPTREEWDRQLWLMDYDGLISTKAQ